MKLILTSCFQMKPLLHNTTRHNSNTTPTLIASRYTVPVLSHQGEPVQQTLGMEMWKTVHQLYFPLRGFFHTVGGKNHSGTHLTHVLSGPADRVLYATAPRIGEVKSGFTTPNHFPSVKPSVISLEHLSNTQNRLHHAPRQPSEASVAHMTILPTGYGIHSKFNPQSRLDPTSSQDEYQESIRDADDDSRAVRVRNGCITPTPGRIRAAAHVEYLSLLYLNQVLIHNHSRLPFKVIVGILHAV